MNGFFDHERATRVVPAADPKAAWTVPGRCAPPRTCGGAESGEAAGRLRPSVAREIVYNHARPSRLAWWVLVVSLVLSVRRWSSTAARLDLAAGAALLCRLRRHELGHRDPLGRRRPHPGLEHVRVAAVPGLGRGRLRGARHRGPAQPHRGPERRRRVRADHGAHRSASDRPLHPPDGAGAVRHLLAGGPRADHHGRLRRPGAGHGGGPHADRGRHLRPRTRRCPGAGRPAVLVHRDRRRSCWWPGS